MCVIAQKAMKAITGYFGGYISKKQKMGNFEIRKSVQALPWFRDEVRSKDVKHRSSQVARCVNRMFTVLEGKGILRMAPEEFLLADKYKASDVLSAEFIRTCRHEFFYGKPLLQRHEALQNHDATITMSVLLPRKKDVTATVDFPSVYGFRPPHPDVFYLSPWEFTQWFKSIPLQIPNTGNKLSKWTET